MMQQHGTRLAAQVVHYGDSVEFYLADYRDGKHGIAEPITFNADNNGMLPPPTFRLSTDAAQEFFEMMWSQGFRSKHDRGGADKLDAARTEHIADLRKAAKLS